MTVSTNFSGVYGTGEAVATVSSSSTRRQRHRRLEDVTYDEVGINGKRGIDEDAEGDNSWRGGKGNAYSKQGHFVAEPEADMIARFIRHRYVQIM